MATEEYTDAIALLKARAQREHDAIRAKRLTTLAESLDKYERLTTYE